MKEIYEDLETLGVAFTAEDMYMINSKCSDCYTAEEHAYIESVMFPNSQVSDETWAESKVGWETRDNVCRNSFRHL